MGPAQGQTLVTHHQAESWAMPMDVDVDVLKEAARQVEQAGSVKPLIMAELKTKIQYERAKKGLPELWVEFEQPPTYELTEDEKISKWKRQQRNRAAAQKSRNKKKEELKTLQETNGDLVSRHQQLAHEVKELKDLKHKLMRGVRNANICSKSYSQRSSKQVVPLMLQSSQRIKSVPTKRYQPVASARPVKSSAPTVQFCDLTQPEPHPSRKHDFMDIQEHLVSLANYSAQEPSIFSSTGLSTTPQAQHAYKGDQMNPYSYPPVLTATTAAPFTSPFPSRNVSKATLYACNDQPQQRYSPPVIATSALPPMGGTSAASCVYGSGQIQQQNELQQMILKLYNPEPHSPPTPAVEQPASVVFLPELDFNDPSPYDKFMGPSNGLPSPPTPASSVSPDHLSDPQSIFRAMQGLNRGA